MCLKHTKIYLKTTKVIIYFLHNSESLNTSVMKPHLFIILFFTGAVPFDFSVPCRYYLIQKSNMWSNAQDYCHNNHTELALMQSNEDMVRLEDEAQQMQFSSSAWIGLYDDVNSWYWSFGNESLGSTRLWASGQPDSWNGNQWCVVINPHGWGDAECPRSIPSVYFDDTKTGDQRYIYISTTMTWYEVQAYDRNHYTDLASVRDTTERSIISGLTSEWTWFGLISESWKWTNHTKFSTISWISGKPDNALKDETCGYLDNGQTTDAQCSYKMSFCCYSEIMGNHQIMTMEVKSDKDINDHALTDINHGKGQAETEEA